jgi:hypothetical protein
MTMPSPFGTASVIQVWDDLNVQMPGYFRAYWCKDPTDNIGSPVVGYCSPGGSHKTIKAVVAEVRRLGHNDPIYRNGKLIDKGTP